MKQSRKRITNWDCTFLSKRLYARFLKMNVLLLSCTHALSLWKIHTFIQLHHCLYVNIYISNKTWKGLRLSRTMDFLTANSTQIMLCIMRSKVFIWIDFISLNVKVTNKTCLQQGLILQYYDFITNYLHIKGIYATFNDHWHD